jgi:hypothetical protein
MNLLIEKLAVVGMTPRGHPQQIAKIDLVGGNLALTMLHNHCKSRIKTFP